MVDRQAESSEGLWLALGLAPAVLLANAAITASGATAAALATPTKNPMGAVSAPDAGAESTGHHFPLTATPAAMGAEGRQLPSAPPPP